MFGEQRRREGRLAAGNEGEEDMDMEQLDRRHTGWGSWWYWLFVIQFVAVLWPPFYNKAEPSFIGMPFFYWYQLLWVILGGVLTATVYFATEE
jgi:hypothetical protein